MDCPLPETARKAKSLMSSVFLAPRLERGAVSFMGWWVPGRARATGGFWHPSAAAVEHHRAGPIAKNYSGLGGERRRPLAASAAHPGPQQAPGAMGALCGAGG
jgi:hypothetical protein